MSKQTQDDPPPIPTLDQVYKQFHAASNAINNLVELLYNSNQNLLQENNAMRAKIMALEKQLSAPVDPKPKKK